MSCRTRARRDLVVRGTSQARNDQVGNFAASLLLGPSRRMAAMTGSVFVRRAVIQIGIAALAGSATILRAQSSEGVLRGRVIDAAGGGIGGASIHVNGTTLGAPTDAFGVYIVRRVSPGSYVAVVRRAGFSPDSFTVTLRGGDTVTHEVTLRLSTQQLERVVVTASPRLNET